MKKNFLSLVFLISALMMLPACDWKSWFSHSCTSCDSTAAHDHASDNSPCCISLDGKPAATQRDFQNKFAQLCMARPDIQQALSSLPAEQQQAFYDQFADAMLAELLVSRYVADAKLLESQEYKTAAAQAHAAVETQLMNSVFQSELFKKIEQKVTPEIAQKYYEENRERLGFLKNPPFIDKVGGVSIQMIETPKESEAKALAVQAQKQDFAKVAKDAQRKVKDLGLVNASSLEADKNIRTKALEYSTVPQVDVVKLSTGKYAVIKATALEKTTYKPFSNPEVKEAVTSYLIRNELGKAVTQTMDELKQKYGAVIHRDSIMELVKTSAPQAPEPSQELQTVAAPRQQLKA